MLDSMPVHSIAMRGRVRGWEVEEVGEEGLDEEEEDMAVIIPAAVSSGVEDFVTR